MNKKTVPLTHQHARYIRLMAFENRALRMGMTHREIEAYKDDMYDLWEENRRFDEDTA